MPAQTWTHVVVVYDSTYEQACTYANGRLVSTQQVKGKLKGSTQPLLIGVELKVRSSPALDVLLFLSALEAGLIGPPIHVRTTARQGNTNALQGSHLVRHAVEAHHRARHDQPAPVRRHHWHRARHHRTLAHDRGRGRKDLRRLTQQARWRYQLCPVVDELGFCRYACAGLLVHFLKLITLGFSGHVDVPKSTLVEDMRKMFNSPLGSDLKLIASDGRELHAHKIILAMRSEAFRALLFGGMRESTQAEIQFPDIKYEVLSLVVEFLYTDTANITGDIVVGLFMAADQYQLGRLRALCEDFILQNISIENVCTIFQTADQLQAHKLRGFCFNWIINNFGEVLTCDAYPQLPAELQREINYAAAKMHFGKKRKLDEATSES